MKEKDVNICCVVLGMFLLIFVDTTGVEGTEKQSVIWFAFQDRIGSVIPIIAEKKGFFLYEGLKVEPLRFNSGPACAEAPISAEPE